MEENTEPEEQQQTTGEEERSGLEETKKNEEDDEEEEIPTETLPLMGMAKNMSKPDHEAINVLCTSLLKTISKGGSKEAFPLKKVKKIVKDWWPKKEILCLYMRIARKVGPNFHLDSISTLLCVSNQCGLTPFGFLTHTKTLVIHPTWSAGKFGLSFSFENTSYKTTTNVKTIDKHFVSLSVTLSLLEHTLSTNVSQAITLVDSTLPANKKKLKSNKQPSKTAQKNQLLQKNYSLIQRLWLAINHCWIAYAVAVNVFENADTENPRDNTMLLEFSLQMYSVETGKTRKKFLDALVGICFRLDTQKTIMENHTRLEKMWKNPPNFISFGCTSLQQESDKEKAKKVVATFLLLKGSFDRMLSYSRSLPRETKWLLLRAYIFWYWLKQPCNSEIGTEVEKPIMEASSTVTDKSSLEDTSVATSHKNVTTK